MLLYPTYFCLILLGRKIMDFFQTNDSASSLILAGVAKLNTIDKIKMIKDA
jgi:hypothetical protein